MHQRLLLMHVPSAELSAADKMDGKPLIYGKVVA
jgi:hypothetical protein